MRYLIFFLVTTSILSCGLGSKTLPPDTEISSENAKQVKGFDNTPESVVMYFYASRIRNDRAWEKVCPPADQRNEDLIHGLMEYNSWTFKRFKFVSKEEFSKDKWWVTIWMEIAFEGETEDGEDQVTVELIDGKYLITEVPT